MLLCTIGIGELSAQEKGEKFFGGKIGIGIQSIQGNDTSVSFTLSPEVGFFVADNFRIGVPWSMESPPMMALSIV